ncbi:MAG TPA: chromate resistance protein ChrB domain-containing protein [Anaerolineales bacterium]|nr:chromate resistance protein ChrB domain-containing protein [Anaerolineales bacterium]
MKWVTWKNIGVDRMACIWLIRRWIDPAAEFSFMPPGEKPLPEHGEPFDIPGARYSHHAGHCTFYAFVYEQKLEDPVLKRIAQMVDEVDEVQEVTVEPAALGLDLICRGVRQISRDDFEALERGSLIYDALYAQLKTDFAPSRMAEN